MPRAEFDDTTLPEFRALLRHLEDREKRQDARAGVIAAAIYNANPFRAEGSRAVQPHDLFPALKPAHRQTKKQTPEQMLAIAAAWAGVPIPRKEVGDG